MSTADNARMTRSASKARSIHSDARVPATPSRQAAPKRTRGPTSHRATSPAAPVAPEEEDKPDVGTKNNRGYGTKGKPGEVQGLSAQTAMGGALDGIASAVNNAEATQDQPYQPYVNPDGLDRVDEEDEDEDEAESSLEDIQRQSRIRALPLIVEAAPRPSMFSLQYWAPQYGHTAAFPVRDSSQIGTNDRMVGYLQWAQDLYGRHPVYVPHLPFSESGVILKSLLCMILALAVWSLLLGPSFLRPQVSSLIANGTQQSLAHDPAYEYNFGRLNIRIGKLENQLHKVRLGSQSLNLTPKRQINWLTPGFGAMVNPHLSSPTASVCDPTWSPYPWNWLFGRTCPEIEISPPQMMALHPWNDPVFDRWCAPRSGGKLQLTVDLDRPIAPTELIVEYAAKDASPTGYMGAAPKEVELWIQVEDDDVRAAVTTAIDGMWPGFLEDSSPQNKELSIEQTLGFGWIPIGRWIYNIYEEDNIQTFKILISLQDYGVGITKVAMRVNSNWGNVDFTCVNRFRLHGHDTSGLIEALEEDPRLVEAS
ncbi:hypothetical protein N7G274_003137 [Stereocaulon virgatum]|uniref:SUN domain-containing protein n=1 Tax=Stereocaulon virgatum TaxID=373712 RepID=A0ABR4AIG4_9LECA